MTMNNQNTAKTAQKQPGLVPYLQKLANGWDISGLNTYE